MTGNKKKPLTPGVRRLCWVLFVAYMVLLAYFLLFAESYGRVGFGSGEFHYNLEPFREIIRCISRRGSLGIGYVLLNLLGNVIGFMPFGFFLSLLSTRCRQGSLILLLSFELSLILEVIQLFTSLGSFDVDDLLLNTLGGFLGYLLWNLESGARRRKKRP